MRRRDFYFKQKVTEAELDAAFDDVELAIKAFLQGFQYVGVGLGADVTESGPPALTVDVSGPAIIYDQNFEKIGWGPTQTVNVALDENGASTAVVAAPNEKWLSIFAEFVRLPADSRVDGNNQPVFFEQNESFKLNVVQGVEAAIGFATRPALRPTQILLADVLIVFGQATILNADIDKAPSATSRTQVIYDLATSPVIKVRSFQEALTAMISNLGVGALTSAGPDTSDPPAIAGGGSISDALQKVLDLLDNRARHTTGSVSVPNLLCTDNPATDQYNILLQTPVGAGGVKLRVYAVADGAFALTLNAAANAAAPPTFTADDNSVPAARLLLVSTGPFSADFSYQASTAAPWASWVNSAQLDTLLVIPSGAAVSMNTAVPALNERWVEIPLNLGATPYDLAGSEEWNLEDPSGIPTWTSKTATARLYLPISARFATGSEIVEVEIATDNAAANMEVDVFSIVTNWGTAGRTLVSHTFTPDNPASGPTVTSITLDTNTPLLVNGPDTTFYVRARAFAIGDKVLGYRVKIREAIYGANW